MSIQFISTSYIFDRTHLFQFHSMTTLVVTADNPLTNATTTGIAVLQIPTAKSTVIKSKESVVVSHACYCLQNYVVLCRLLLNTYTYGYCKKNNLFKAIKS